MSKFARNVPRSVLGTRNGKYTADKVPTGPVIVTVRTAEMRQMYLAMKKARESGKGGEVITQLPGAGQGTAKNLQDKLKGKKGPPALPGAKELAKKQDEVWNRIKDMIDVERPVIVDCVVDQTENCFPMIPAGRAHNEMILGNAAQELDRAVTEEGKVLV